MDYKSVSKIGLGLLALRSLYTSSEKSHMYQREGAPANQTGLENVVDAGLNDYVSDEYGITFKYPASWSKNPRYEDKYEGRSGFFEVSGFEGNANDIDAAVQDQINEPNMPYGSNPTVRRLVVDGQPAREIISSDDQADIITDRDIALVVQYKTPVTVDGVQYPYLIIWTDRQNLPLIIRSLKFIQLPKVDGTVDNTI